MVRAAALIGLVAVVTSNRQWRERLTGVYGAGAKIGLRSASQRERGGSSTPVVNRRAQRRRDRHDRDVCSLPTISLTVPAT